MRRLALAGLLASCAQIESYQSQATVSPSFAQLKAPLRLAVLPVAFDGGAEGPSAFLEVSVLDDEVTPGEVFVDGSSAGSVDWVEGKARVPVNPGRHLVRLDEFMGDELGRVWVDVEEGEVVKLAYSGGRLEVVGSERAPKPKALSQDFAQNALGAEALRTGRFSLLERSKIDEVLREQEFSASGLVDPSRAVRLGKLLGAQAVLTSSCSFSYDADLGGWVALLSGRVISVESGEVLYVARARGFGFDQETAFEQAAGNFFRGLRK